MPELPEVETMRRGIRPVVGSRVVSVDRCRLRARPIQFTPAGAAFDRRLLGCTIEDVDRLGKRVVVRLDGGLALVFEPRMTGLVLLADPPTRDHLRLRIGLAPGASGQGVAGELLYWDRRGLGLVRLLSARQLDAHYGPTKLGPDALSISAELLAQRLAGSRREIKVALLDQQAVAGIGNLYASEILHRAAIHPQVRCDRLRDDDWDRLHAATAAVLRAAIRYEGSTLADGTYRNALNQQGGFQNHHRVYDRSGETCGGCRRSRVVRIVQAQRSTFFCPVCQPRRHGRR